MPITRTGVHDVLTMTGALHPAIDNALCDCVACGDVLGEHPARISRLFDSLIERPSRLMCER